MKTYQIAETVIVGDSLPACFSAFQIEKQKTADCVVKTSTTVLSGTKKVIHRYCHDTFIVHQLQSGEWVYTIPEETDSVQLLASQDYRNLRYFVPETLKIS
ncbi:MAG: hypothetical protein Q4B70_14935, partial [Lachnospiraceae bacterium]|nr:hypothetical protein [Lachnospiraceae bacterium]